MTKTTRWAVRGYLKSRSLVGNTLSLWHFVPLKLQCQGGCWIRKSGPQRRYPEGRDAHMKSPAWEWTRRPRSARRKVEETRRRPNRGYTARGQRPGEVSITEAKGGWDELHNIIGLVMVTAHSSVDRNERERPLLKKIPNSYFEGPSSIATKDRRRKRSLWASVL